MVSNVHILEDTSINLYTLEHVHRHTYTHNIYVYIHYTKPGMNSMSNVYLSNIKVPMGFYLFNNAPLW